MDTRENFIEQETGQQEKEKIGTELLQNSQEIGTELLQNSQEIGIELLQNSQEIGTALLQNSQELGTELLQNSQEIGTELQRAKEKLRAELLQDAKVETTDLPQEKTGKETRRLRPWRWLRGSSDRQSKPYLSNLLLPFLFFTLTVIYLEVVFHSLIYRCIDSKLIYPILFALPSGCILTIICGFFGKRLNRVILWGLTLLLCLVFEIQLVYYYVFKVFFSFQSLGLAEDAFTNFYGDILQAIRSNIGGLVSLMVPFMVLAVILSRRLDHSRRRLSLQALLCGGCALFHATALFCLLLFGRGDYSPYDLYFHAGVPDLCGQQLGIVTMTRLDIAGLFTQEEKLVLADMQTPEVIEPYATPTPLPDSIPAMATQADLDAAIQAEPDVFPTVAASPTPVPLDTSPNVMDFDFDTLAEQEKNKTIKSLHQYFAEVAPTNRNEYTGKFAGYNLIMITAEGFSPYAVNQDKTPTLYRLVREGFVFNHFYTSLWQTSTSDGEYVAMTGLIPSGTRSMYHGRKNLWPFSLGHQFNSLGVESKAYHDHTYTYYQRNVTHTNLGYVWKARGNGLTLPSDCWPESDLEMIDATVEEYTDENPFHVYYLTVSGHMNYTFQGNSMASKNKELVADLPYSEEAKAYIACQMELDKALEQLIKKLNEAGVADRTVIALSADHYPYGWEKKNLDELAGHELDPDFEIYQNHFILWNQGMEESIIVDKPCSSLDILPTLSNLFGIKYDSRLLMGQDILSDSEPLVILGNRSFITDKVKYNSATGEATLLTDEPLPEDYISNRNKLVKNKFTVSRSMLEEDYYRYLYAD